MMGTQLFTPEPFWHVHHCMYLIQWTYEPIERRIEYIQAYKPKHERATRLRLLKPVQGKLPDELVQAGAVFSQAWAMLDQAWATYRQAWATYDQTGIVYDQARAAYDQAYRACLPAIEALHAQECPECPWDGRTIFPQEKLG